MLKATTRYVAWVFPCFAIWAGTVRAQQISPEDEGIDAMRTRTDIGPSDERRIAEWVELQVDRFTEFVAFRTRFREQYDHPDNSPEFRLDFAVGTARVAATQFAKPDLKAGVAHALARILIDMSRPETFPGLIAGLKSSDAAARYLCAKGLTAQKASSAADKARLDQAIQALREAGSADTSPVVLGRIYEALAYPEQVAAVFDSYMSLFDKRLTFRRGPAAIADGAEIYAFEFFRKRAVLGGLSAEQKSQLARRLAVFLRLDAERYAQTDLDFAELDRIERMLDGAEEILVALLGENGGRIHNALSAGGHANREAALREAYRWVGDSKTTQRGALNEAPWNVPIGAP